MLLSDPVLQKLNGRLVAEGRMLPFSVVENLDRFKGGRLDLGMSRVANTVNPLVLEAVEPTFRRRVVPAVPFAAHAADDMFLGYHLLVSLGAVLTATI